MSSFIRRPEKIEFVQWTGDNTLDVVQALNARIPGTPPINGVSCVYAFESVTYGGAGDPFGGSPALLLSLGGPIGAGSDYLDSALVYPYVIIGLAADRGDGKPGFITYYGADQFAAIFAADPDQHGDPPVFVDGPQDTHNPPDEHSA